MTRGKRVTCKSLGQDFYDREIATCTAGDTDIGRAMVAQGDWQGAIEAFQQAAEQLPGQRLPWVEIGNSVVCSMLFLRFL